MLERLQDYWLAACPSRRLRSKPVPVTVLGRHLVLARLDGRPVAMEDRCPHRNAPLSQGRICKNQIICPYHGWSFDGQGACRAVPGLCGQTPATAVPIYPAREHDNIVWVAFQTGALEPYRPTHTGFYFSAKLHGTMLNVLENFLDATHTHFVHSGLIRSEGVRQKTRVEVIAQADRVEANYFDEGSPAGLISRLFEGRRTSSHGRFILPSTAEIKYCSQRGTEFQMTAYLTPENEHSHNAHVLIATPQTPLPNWLKRFVLTPFLRAALRQDARILRLQHDNLERFGGENFHSTPLDVLRSHILRLLKGGPGPEFRREVEMEL